MNIGLRLGRIHRLDDFDSQTFHLAMMFSDSGFTREAVLDRILHRQTCLNTRSNGKTPVADAMTKEKCPKKSVVAATKRSASVQNGKTPVADAMAKEKCLDKMSVTAATKRSASVKKTLERYRKERDASRAQLATVSLQYEAQVRL